MVTEKHDLSFVPPRRPPDPLGHWRSRFQEIILHNKQSECPRFIPLDELVHSLNGFFAVKESRDPVLYEYTNAVIDLSCGAAYSFETGVALEGTFLRRMPAGVQFPHCTSFHIEPFWHWNGIQTLKGSAYYIPFSCFDNFGHFITETLSFLWPFVASSNSLSGCPVILGSTRGHVHAELVVELLERFGCNPIFADQLPSQFLVERLLAPSSLFSLHNFIFRSYPLVAQELGVLARSYFQSNDYPTNGRYLYISRAGLSSGHRSITGESEIEGRLSSLGWTILYPERMDLGQQVAAYSSADAIAGFEGSAFHCLALCSFENAKPLVILLGDSLSPDFLLQFSAQQITGYYAACSKLDPSSLDAPCHSAPRQLVYAPHIIANSIDSIAKSHKPGINFL